MSYLRSSRKLAWPAAVAAGALMFSPGGQAFAEDAEAQQPQAQVASAQPPATATFPPGVELDEADDRGGIHSTLDGLTEAAIKGDFGDVVERLVDQDRNRIGEWMEQADRDYATLEAAQETFQVAWRQKYGKEFEVESDRAFATIAIIQGEITDPVAVAAHWPIQQPVASPADPTDAAVPAAATEPGTDQPAQPGAEPDAAPREPVEEKLDEQGQSNLEAGRDVAVATFPPSGPLPALHVSLIEEVHAWRIDAPNTIDGAQLQDKLVRHLQHLSTNAAAWPADEALAARGVAQHVLAAVYGVELSREQPQPGAPADGASDAAAPEPGR